MTHVLWAETKGNALNVDFLARKKPKSHLSLFHVTKKLTESELEAATAFAESLMDAAYKGTSCLPIYASWP